jgi:hypothetical protein
MSGSLETSCLSAFPLPTVPNEAFIHKEARMEEELSKLLTKSSLG